MPFVLLLSFVMLLSNMPPKISRKNKYIYKTCILQGTLSCVFQTRKYFKCVVPENIHIPPMDGFSV